MKDAGDSCPKALVKSAAGQWPIANKSQEGKMQDAGDSVRKALVTVPGQKNHQGHYPLSCAEPVTLNP